MLKKLAVYVVVLLFVIPSVFNCGKESPTKPEGVNEFDLVASVGDDYFTSYTTPSGNPVNTTISNVFTILTDGDDSNDPYIIDYRSASDFASGHIKGAVNMSLGSLISNIENGKIPKNKTILNVCYTGQTASHATAVLNMLGYDAQNLLFGMCGVTTSSEVNGTDKWSKQIATDEYATQLVSTPSTPTKVYDFPKINTGKKTAEEIIKARFTAYLNSKGGSWANITADQVFEDPSSYFIINYWPESDYNNPGHIPGAYQFTPKSSLRKDQKLKYLPTDKEIVVYCYSGQTSAQVVAYLQILGYDAYSLLFGVNGFAYNSLSAHKYVAPVTDYSSILTTSKPELKLVLFIKDIFQL
ncbi:hypothetical protein DRQ09_04055 [candidate division KSB1 bacterium]|nr:MAG: hypothetical protein DRQ09_04055 [candidate division KSB1 bacterium]